MGNLVCESNKCTGCKACIDICPKDALIFRDSLDVMNVEIDIDKCVNCGACHRVCQVNNPVLLSKPIFWKQGWAVDEVRRSSSSGGFAAQLMGSFMDDNSYVCSCAFKEGRFGYFVTNKYEIIENFKGSKYVKSDPKGVYRDIAELLKKRYRVLFVGLPCHIAALKNYLNGKYRDNLFTIDLICHGSPSPNILGMFLKEHNYDINEIGGISFRTNNRFALNLGNGPIVPLGAHDRYTLGFLRGLFYTDNCYSCNYAQLNRVSDITIGDSWGTDLSGEEERGISLALCQTEKGKKLLLNAGLNLYDVDLEKAVVANHQLSTPSIKITERERFFKTLNKTNNVGRSIFDCFPKDCLKQGLKGFLIKTKIIKR